MATKKQTNTKARVLVEGSFGKPDDVVELAPAEFDVALASGQVDPHPDAVAYAAALKAPVVEAPAVEAAPAEPAPIEAAPEPVAE